MAGKKTKTFASKDYNPDDDFNFGDMDSAELGEFGSPDEASRKPSENFKQGIKEGIKGHFTSPETYKKAIKDNFPHTYGKVIESGDDSLEAISKVYGAAGKAIKPAVKDLKRVAKLISPAADKVMPKAMAERFKKWSQPEQAFGIAAADMREASIRADLESVFVVRDKEAHANRAEDSAKDAIKEGVEQIRHTDMLGALNSIKDSTLRVASYQDSTLVNFQRMSLQTQLRAFSLQAEDSQLTRNWMESMRASTEDIKKNTALPDFVKRHTVEDLKAMSRNRLIGKTLNLVGDNTRFISDWGDKISKQVSTSITGLVSGFVGGAGMLLDQIEAGKDSGFDPANMAGDMVGTTIAGSLGDKLSKKLLGPLATSKNPAAVGFRKLGLRMATRLTNLKDTLTRKSKGENGQMTMLSRFLAMTLPTEDNQVSIQTHTTDNLQAPAVFDNQSRRTLNEAIPGYFARVLRELQIIRTGNVNIGLTRFDFSSGKFMGDAELKNKLYKSIISDDAVASKKYATEKMGKLIDPDGNKLSPEAMKAMHEQMMNDRAKGTGRTTEEYMNPATYTGTAAPHAHQIARAFQEYIGKGDGEVFKNGEGNNEAQLQKIHTLHKSFQDVGRYSQVDAGNIQNLYNMGYGDELEEMGIIKDGRVDNDKLMQYLSGELKYNPTGGSTRATGLNENAKMRKVSGGRDSMQAQRTRMNRQNAVSGSYDNVPQFDPNAQGQGAKDIVDAIRANSTKSATDMILESVRQLVTIGASNNDALMQMSGGTQNKPGWFRRLLGAGGKGVGAVGSSAMAAGRAGTMAARFGLGTAGKLIGGAAEMGWNGIKSVGRFGMRKLGFGDGEQGPTRNIFDRLGSVGKSLFSGAGKALEAADIFVRGEVIPRISEAGIKAGEFFDYASGKVISSFKDIKGAVKDRYGKLVLTGKDLLDSYVKTPGMSERWEKVKKAGSSTWDTLTGLVSGRVSVMDAMGRGFEKLKGLMGSAGSRLNGEFQDVYKKSDLLNPILKGEDVKAGRCFKTGADGNTGEQLRSVLDITGPIVGVMGNYLVTQADITEGLCDRQGNALKARSNMLKGGLLGLKNKIAGSLAGIKGFLGGGLSGATNMLSDLFGAGGFNNSSKRSTNVLLQIRNLLDDRMPGERIGYSDNKDEFLKETTPGAVTAGKAAQKAKALFMKAKGALAAKGGLKGLFGSAKDRATGAYDRFTGSEKYADGKQRLSGFFGGLKERAMDMFGGMGGRSGSRASQFGRIGWGASKSGFMGPMMPTYGPEKPKIAGDSDGDGDRDGSYADMIARRAKDGTAKAKEIFKGFGKDKKGRGLAGIFMGILGAIKGIGGTLLSAVSSIRALSAVTKVIGPLMRLVGMGGAASTILGAGGAATAATTVAAGAGTVTAAGAVTTGAVATVAGGTAAAGGTALAGLFWPVTAVVVGLAAVGYAGYRVYKWANSTPLTPLSKLRMLQYGVDYDEDGDRAQTLLNLETLTHPALMLTGDGSKVDPGKFDTKAALELFGISDPSSAEAKNFERWFQTRFLPVYAGSVRICNEIFGSKDLGKAATGKKEERQAYFDRAKAIVADFDMLLSPWSGDTSGWFSSVKKLPINSARLKFGIEKLQAELSVMKSSSPGRGKGSFVPDAPGEKIRNPDDAAAAAKTNSPASAADKAMQDARKGMADANQSGGGSRTGITASNAEVYLNPSAVADELLSIRMRAYGLIKLDTAKVQHLLRLEKEMMTSITFKGDVASFEGSIGEAATTYGPIFGIVDASTPEAGEFVVWLMYRFIPAYLAALTAVKRHSGKSNLFAGIMNLKAEHLLLVADSIIAATLRGASIWKVPQTPWKGCVANMDPGSCDTYLDNIRAMVKEATIAEANKKSQPTAQSNTPAGVPEPGIVKTNFVIPKANSFRGDIDDAEGEKPAGVQSNPGASSSGTTMAGGGLASGENGMAWLNFNKGVDLEGINPEFRKNLLAMAEEYGALTGKKLTLTDGHRSTPEQAKLYASMPKGRAAKPGTSLHEFGLAIDADPAALDALDKMGLMKKYGFTRPVGAEPWHVEAAGIQGNLDGVRRDPNLATQAVAASLGAGGGGYGTVSGARKYGRDPALAVALFNNKDPIGSGAFMTTKMDNSANMGNVSTVNVSTSANASPEVTSPSSSFGKRGGYANSINKLVNTAVDPMQVSKNAGSGGGDGSGLYASMPTVNPNEQGWPAYKALIAAAATGTGVSVQAMAAKAAVESGFRGNVKSDQSSASGLFQFTEGTWGEMMKKYAAKYGIPPNASPSDARANAILAGLYYKENEKSAGGSFSPVDGYISHLLGTTGGANFRQAMKSNPDALVSTAVSKEAISGNSAYFTRDGRILTVRESYDQIASNYQKKYAAFGVAKDLGNLDLGGGTMTAANTSGGASTVMVSSTTPGYAPSTRPTASPSETYTPSPGRRNQAPSGAVTEMLNAVARPSYARPMATPENVPTAPMNENAVVARNTSELVTISRAQLDVLTQIKELMTTFSGGKPATSSDNSAPSTNPGFKPKEADRNVRPSVSMSRTV